MARNLDKQADMEWLAVGLEMGGFGLLEIAMERHRRDPGAEYFEGQHARH